MLPEIYPAWILNAAQAAAQRPRNTENRPAWGGFSMPFFSGATGGLYSGFSAGVCWYIPRAFFAALGPSWASEIGQTDFLPPGPPGSGRREDLVNRYIFIDIWISIHFYRYMDIDWFITINQSFL